MWTTLALAAFRVNASGTPRATAANDFWLCIRAHWCPFGVTWKHNFQTRRLSLENSNARRTRSASGSQTTAPHLTLPRQAAIIFTFRWPAHGQVGRLLFGN